MLKTTFPKSRLEIPEAEELTAPASGFPESACEGGSRLRRRLRAENPPPRGLQTQEEEQVGPGPKAVTFLVLKGWGCGLQGRTCCWSP